MLKGNKILITITILLFIASVYLVYSNVQFKNELEDKQTEISTLEYKVSSQEQEIESCQDQLSECKEDLKTAQIEMIQHKSFSSRTYYNGNLMESYDNIEDAYNACKRKLSDLEDELRRCKNNW
jgi:chromosome segregation ATPase